MSYPYLFTRSIYIEILQKTETGATGSVLESFAMTIPPENIKVKQTQRITETPTPGGMFIDNYGLGVAKITISGTTSNGEERLTVVGPNHAPQYFTGKTAYQYLRDKIVRYSQDNDNYEMRLYDFTHKGSLDITNDFAGVDTFTEAWEVILGDFDTNRTSATPFFYPITLDFTAIRPIGVFNPSKISKVLRVISDIGNYITIIQTAISDAEEVLNLLVDTTYMYYSDAVGLVNYVKNFGTKLDQFSSKLDEFNKKTSALFSEVLNEKETSLQRGVVSIEFPEKELENARVALLEYKEANDVLIQRMAADGYQEKEFSWDDETTTRSADLLLNYLDIEINFNPIVQIAKQTASTEAIAAVSINGIVTPIYGYTVHYAQANTTLERLALSGMGDPDYKDIISVVNGIYSDDEIVSGDVIKIPILQPLVRFTTNEVYNVISEQSDLIGRDVKVDTNGEFVMDPTGDYSLTSGKETIGQSIFFRLSEQRNRQVRSQEYGVLLTLGRALNAESPVEYIATSIRETLLQDPRILSVTNVKLKIDGDAVSAIFDYTNIENNVQEYREGF